MQRAAWAAVAMALAIVGISVTASGQCVTDCERGRARTRGLEISAHMGAGGFYDDTATAFTQEPPGPQHLFWPGFGAQLHVGYRFMPWMSVGLRGTYNVNTTRDLPQGATSSLAHTISAGTYVRGYFGPLLGSTVVDPWFSVGVDPFATVRANTATPLGDQRTRILAVGIPVAAGLDFNVVRGLSLGLMAQASPWVPYEICRELGTGSTSCTNNNLEVNPYLYAGLGVRYTFGLR